MTDAQRRERRVLLGHIVGAHGVKGAVLVRSYTEDPEAIASYGALEDEAGRARFELEVDGATGKGLICRVTGVGDRTQAEALKGAALYVARDKLPDPGEGEYYHVDLVGLDAVTEEMKPLGRVVGVLNFGAGDILEIKPEGAARTVLYPMMEAVVRRIDFDQGVIVLTPPDEVDAGDRAAAETDEA